MRRARAFLGASVARESYFLLRPTISILFEKSLYYRRKGIREVTILRGRNYVIVLSSERVTTRDIRPDKLLKQEYNVEVTDFNSRIVQIVPQTKTYVDQTKTVDNIDLTKIEIHDLVDEKDLFVEDECNINTLYVFTLGDEDAALPSEPFPREIYDYFSLPNLIPADIITSPTPEVRYIHGKYGINPIFVDNVFITEKQTIEGTVFDVRISDFVNIFESFDTPVTSSDPKSVKTEGLALFMLPAFREFGTYRDTNRSLIIEINKPQIFYTYSFRRNYTLNLHGNEIKYPEFEIYLPIPLPRFNLEEIGTEDQPYISTMGLTPYRYEDGLPVYLLPIILTDVVGIKERKDELIFENGVLKRRFFEKVKTEDSYNVFREYAGSVFVEFSDMILNIQE